MPFFTHTPFVVNCTFNTTPTERLLQHPLLFTTNSTDRTSFLWRFHTTRPSHPGHSTILLQSESLSGKCAKLLITLWQQATVEITCYDHSIIACSCHIYGPYCVNSQEVVKAPSPIFLVLLKLSLPHMMNICKIWMKSVKEFHDYKAFSCWAYQGDQIVHIWPCLKHYYCQTTLVNNPNISGMLVTLPNIENITLSTLWLSKVMDPQSWLFLALATDFRKFSNFTVGFISLKFSLIFGRIVSDKIIFDIRKFIEKYQKVCEIFWAKLGTKWKK